ncbi:WD repeat-containing protein WDS homolog [Actinidia eriantha]|uniref:WD repeat-containing protein WDS homolog n=1 Tax=Actinidia eriantha TaxID=165200 RepID=UPI0025861BAD|nr:WD repeat-containing protein WDS homolog [Actinidia eriantha]XP_057508980.1 WD repeat-containing protein WDS homolog [Actinidia eriantha]XP_057508981.1 WD repeat-containing protein WDS homolog [Actinidia eriantha]
MENRPTMLGPKGLIKKHEFVRTIIQSLYSLGFKKSGASLELESGISYKSVEFGLLESQVLNANWDACIDTLYGLKGLTDETRASALFIVCRQSLFEFLLRGDDSSALSVLRKQISALHVGREKVHNLAFGVLSLKEMGFGTVDGDVILESRKKLLSEMEKLLPPPFILPERRLEHLVEMTVNGQIDSCMYHNTWDPISIYEDHRCGRDQIPTETIQILTDHKNEVWFVQFSNSGEYLASSSCDCTAIIWKVLENGKMTLKHTLRSHQKPVSFVAWSPDDTMLLTCGNLEVLKLWDVESGTCKRTFGNHSFTVSSCAWFPDSNRLVCGSSDAEKGICMWDCEGNEIKSWKGSRMPKVLDIAVTPDGENLISIFGEKDIRILNVMTNADRVISEEHPITSLSISGDGKFLIVNLNSQEIHMWDVAGKSAKPLKYMGHRQHKYVIRSCFGGSNSMFIASGSENSQVYIWNRRSPNPIEILSGHSMTVNSVSWNPKRPQMLASASDDQTIRIWGPSCSKKAA